MKKDTKQCIDELKELYGYNAKDKIIKGYRLEEKKGMYRCNNSIAHNNNDKTFSMSWDNKLNHFYCFRCDAKPLDIYTYFTEIEGKEFDEIMKENNIKDNNNSKEVTSKKVTSISKNKDSKVFKIKHEMVQPLNNECLNYIISRKISKDTIKYFDICTYNNKVGFIHRNKKNEIIGMKLRKPKKVKKAERFDAVPGSDYKFFNQKNFDEDFIFICEGEFDCMVLHECGYINSISVPTGATSLSKFFESEKEYLKKFKYFIIFSDNDEAGKDMDMLFLKEFPTKIKFVDKSIMDTKDINEEYFEYGKDRIDRIIESATIKIEGFRDLDKTPYKGMSSKGIKFIPTGFDSLDQALNQFETERMTLITGRPGEGKSTFVSQIQNFAIDKGYSVARIDGEHAQEKLINDTYVKAVGFDDRYFDIIKFNLKYIKEPKKETLEALKKWHKNKLFLYSKGESKLSNTDELFDIIRNILNTEKIDLLILDNLMSLLSCDSIEKNEKQSEFIKKCHDLCLTYNIHVILVAHTNKQALQGKKIDVYNISGSADLSGVPDNIIHVSKTPDEDKQVEQCDGFLHLLKNRGYGNTITIKTQYVEETSMLLELKDNKALYKKIDWERFLKKDNTSLNVLKNEKIKIDNDKKYNCPF
jgi:twinkle protein